MLVLEQITIVYRLRNSKVRQEIDMRALIAMTYGWCCAQYRIRYVTLRNHFEVALNRLRIFLTWLMVALCSFHSHLKIELYDILAGTPLSWQFVEGKWLLVILYLAISLVPVFYSRLIWASGVKSTRNCTELPYYLTFAKQKRNRALSTEDIFLFISFICYSVLFNVLSKMVVQFQAWSKRIPKSFSYSKL